MFGFTKHNKEKPTQTVETSDHDAALLVAVTQSAMVIWLNRDLVIEKASKTVSDFYNAEPKDIVGKSLYDFMPEGARNTHADEAVRTCVESGKTAADTVPRVGRNGQKFWFSSNYFPVLGDDGQVEKVVIVGQDVTPKASKIAEKVAQMAAISDAQAQIVFDLDGTIIEANDNFLAAMGYTRDEVIGNKHRMFLTEEYAKSDDYAQFWDRARRGELQKNRFSRICKDGSQVWLDAFYAPILGMDGKPEKVVKLASNITDLRQALELIEAIARAQGSIEFDMDGTIVTANQNFLDAVGYTLDEVVGKNHSMFIFDDALKSGENANHWQKLRNGDVCDGEYKRKRKDGSELWILASYNPILGPDGKPYRVVKFAQDITDRKFAVEKLSEALSMLSQGDLTSSINHTFSDAFEPLRQDFNVALGHLQSSLRSVVNSSSEIRSGTNEISSAANDLSRRTESQAASLEETSAAIIEMAASVKSTSEVSQKTSDFVEKTKAHAGAGSEVMDQARKAMSAISESSSEISKITTVIEDIAFQTNLLALNAGVEAARAGEAGRGFAVVASEVRALAQRSSEAATQISDLISNSVKQVDDGVQLVGRTGESLIEIGSFVGEIAQMVAEITAAATEQSGGLSEIQTAVGSLDEVAQKNAAMFEETNAATQLLLNEVQTLGQVTENFRLDTTHAVSEDVKKRAS